MSPAISIHPPHAGRDANAIGLIASAAVFQSTLPMRGGTWSTATPAADGVFQSTLPMRGGTPTLVYGINQLVISIHPPHAGRDVMTLSGSIHGGDFNPPSPCGEGPAHLFLATPAPQFQSTLPMRGGTLRSTFKIKRIRFQSTLPMRGGTVTYSVDGVAVRAFQSTLPMRGGTIALNRFTLR